MLQQIMTGQTKAIILLGVAMGLFLYFLPSVMAFVRAKKRFWLVLVLNIALTFVQSAIMQKLFPGLLTVHPGDVRGIWTTSLVVNFGPGWIALLVWALWPGESDPRLLRAQQTKTYDAFMALPLILWFAYGALQLRPVLAHDVGLIASGSATLFNWVQFVALSMTALFDMLLIYLLMVRDTPVAKSRGALPRIFAFAGTFLGVGILQLPGLSPGAVAAGQKFFDHARGAQAGDRRALCPCAPSPLHGGDDQHRGHRAAVRRALVVAGRTGRDGPLMGPQLFRGAGAGGHLSGIWRLSCAHQAVHTGTYLTQSP